mmetsp:Transcript_4292/g.6602  ORF Transcript_4292/g.6602 Transcript_4292/m.6602 type:complete len:209 (-) Transcript_4292:33-659(-)
MPLAQTIGGDAVDALPYIDKLYEHEDEKKAVDKLIQDEMKTFTRPNYLASLPAPPFDFKESIFVQTELERIKAGQPMAVLDTSRYQIEQPPPNKKNDIQAWKQCVANAQAQLEHQHLRLLNLELMNKYGANCWKVINSITENAAKQFEANFKKCRERIDQTNRERSAEQIPLGQELDTLEFEWQTLVQKTLEIDTACYLLERSMPPKS